jgi:hypothetical protein
VLSRYFPADVEMHSFENVRSAERKRANWAVLERLFARRGIPVDKRAVDAVIAAEGDAAAELLLQLHAFVSSPAYA